MNFTKLKNLFIKQKLKDNQPIPVEIREAPMILDTTSKTFIRLDLLEENSIMLNEKLPTIEIDIAYLKDKINNFPTNSNDKADVVLDTTDNQYKNVKYIVIDKAIKSNTILDPTTGQYVDIKTYLDNNYQPTIPYEVERSKTSGGADKVLYGQGYQPISNVLLDYIKVVDIRNALINNTTYDGFKSELIRIIGSRKVVE